MIGKLLKQTSYYQPILLFFVFSACNRSVNENTDNKLFKLMPASYTNASFVNYLDYKKQIEKKFNIYTYRNFYNGAGVALSDFNNDGLIDIFLSSNMGTNTLYLNKGNFKFEDISERAGIQGKGQWSTGASAADVNGDGWIDIYVCNSGIAEGDDRRNELFINNGDNTFTEQAEKYGIDDPGFSTHAVFFDYDKDQDLDLYLLNNSSKAIGSFNLKDNKRNEKDSLGGDRLYMNTGNNFVDVSKKAGIYGSVIGFGLGIAISDINVDGWPDIYVSNDFFERDYIYINNQDGTFSESLEKMISSVSAASMGGDIADLNNDIHPEIFTTDMVPEDNERLKTKTTFDSWESYKSNLDNGYHHQFTRNMLQLNNGDGTFSEIGRFAGINATDWSWGALIADIDNDGLKDIFVANGIFKDLTDQDYLQYFSNRDMAMSVIKGNKVDYGKLIDAIPSVKIPNYAFKNLGNNQFKNLSLEWGLAEPSFSNGSAYGDLDNDGDLDIVVNNVNMPVFIYKNNTDKVLSNNHFLKIILKGEGANTLAIGTRITAIHNGSFTSIEQMPVRGYLSSVDPRPVLGLGKVGMIDSLIVEWPDSRITLLKNVKSNQVLTLNQKEAVKMDLNLLGEKEDKKKIFEDITSKNYLDFFHNEDDFNDFERDPLLFRMYSSEGPRMCSGDVNGDGLDDIYICGPKGQQGVLMLQQKNGSFRKANIKIFDEDKISEDADCAMFDADNDGDIDIYVASGSNEFPESSSALADRLYLNEGKGNFKKSEQVLPAGKYESTGCVKPCDYDGDGVMELFVGLRLKPFLYGVPVNGYILENDGKGNFTNITPSVAPELQKIGMIRDMSWTDVDGDMDMDMIIAGDWMQLKIFINEKGKFIQKKDAFGKEKTNGWWNCIETGDFDNDGDIDFVAGNHGLNSKFKASAEKPVEMYVNDFDNNGAVEQIICAYNGDKSFPLALKHDLTRQIPALEKKYPKYEMYKNQQINEIFTPDQLKNSVYLSASQLETSIFINDGKGNFTINPLPLEIQYSPVFAAEVHDFNQDGNLDILLGGNLMNVKPESGAYDACYGKLLIGDGKGSFSFIPSEKSGFRLTGEMRDILRIKTSIGNIVLIARSKDSLKLFRINEN